MNKSNLLAQSFYQTLKKENLKNKTLVLALSAGIDSSVLAYLLKQYQQEFCYKLIFVHINHNLQKSSKEFAKKAKSIGAKYQVETHIFDVFINNKKSNIEEQARDKRYTKLFEFIKNESSKYYQSCKDSKDFKNRLLVLAHHLDDKIETFFLNLKRGAGVVGLNSLNLYKTRENILIFRPFINFLKTDIKRFAKEQQVDFIEDKTNKDLDFDRNFIRNKILKDLNQRWSNIAISFKKTFNILNDQTKLLEELSKIDFNNCFCKKNKELNVSEMQKLSNLRLANLLYFFLKEQNILLTKVQIREIIKTIIFAKKDRVPTFFYQDLVLTKYNNFLKIVKKNNFFHQEKKDITITNNIFLIEKLSQELAIKILDIRKLNPNIKIKIKYNLPLTYKIKIQKRSTKTLKQLCKEKKIEPWKRTSLAAIFLNNEIFYIEKIGFIKE